MRGLTVYGRTGKFTYRMLMSVLVGQSVAVFLGALVARGLTAAGQPGVAADPSAATRYLWIGIGLAVLCLVAAGLMRSPLGVTLGWVVEVLTIAAAAIVPAMGIVGLLFLALWVTCLVQGARVDRLQRQREATWAAQAEAAPRR